MVENKNHAKNFALNQRGLLSPTSETFDLTSSPSCYTSEDVISTNPYAPTEHYVTEDVVANLAHASGAKVCLCLTI